MQTTVFRLMMGPLLCLSILLGVGCSDISIQTPSGAETQNKPPELVSLKQTDSSFTAVVARGDARVTINVQRTGPRVPGFIRDPEIDSPYESDAIIRNRHGFPFILSYGGSAPTNLMETENMSLDFPKDANQEEQMADLQLAADAAQILRDNPDIGERFRWELRDVFNMAEEARSEAIKVHANPPTPQPTPRLDEIRSEAIGPVMSAEPTR